MRGETCTLSNSQPSPSNMSTLLCNKEEKKRRKESHLKSVRGLSRSGTCPVNSVFDIFVSFLTQFVQVVQPPTARLHTDM